jgi:hypothetical protein
VVISAGRNFVKICCTVVTSITISATGLQELDTGYAGGVWPLLLSWWALEWVLLLLPPPPPPPPPRSWSSVANQLGRKPVAAASVDAPAPPVTSGTWHLGIFSSSFHFEGIHG